MDFRSAGFTGRPLLRAVSYDDRIGTINRDLTLSLESEFQAPLKRGLRPKGGGGFLCREALAFAKKKPDLTAFGGATVPTPFGLRPFPPDRGNRPFSREALG